tara:strand:- start:417 stop:974 length:558 start_codon:yes stop_codon:yes gene_type:complete
MKTGSGIIHSEMPAMKDGRLHGFQLWINMPAEEKMSKPEYHYIDADKISTYKDEEKIIKIIAGEFLETKGSIKKHNIDPVYFDIELEKNKEFKHELPLSHNSFIYLIEGEINIGTKSHELIDDSTLIILTKGEYLNVCALKKSKFLLISGKPIGEPIARGGPFVMNTKEEIAEAIQDYHSGTFVK